MNKTEKLAVNEIANPQIAETTNEPQPGLRELARLIPAFLRLAKGALGDARVSRRHKFALGALVVYLALPFDLIPDFLPIIGYADDLIIAWLVLRKFVRGVPPEVIADHWTGEFSLQQCLDAVSKAMKTACSK